MAEVLIWAVENLPSSKEIDIPSDSKCDEYVTWQVASKTNSDSDAETFDLDGYASQLFGVLRNVSMGILMIRLLIILMT